MKKTNEIELNEKELREIWKREEELAHIKGWDFSYLDGRFEEDDRFPWDYADLIHQYVTDDMKIMDYDTGGGEFPDFSVDRCFDKLLALQRKIEEKGFIEGTIHRYMIVAKNVISAIA